MSNASFFEIRNATVWRGDTPALRDVSLELRLGESVAILGPNGAGKSTLIKLLTGELRPEARSGTTCRLFGEENYSVWDLRHRIGMVMQDELDLLDSAENALDVVLSSLRSAYGRTRWMRFSANEKSAAAKAIDRVGMSKLTNRSFGALSSGEKRRLQLARALVHHPSVLVFDEPSAALDFTASIGLIQVMRDLIRSGHSLVLVTHHPGEIPPEIERVILLERGVIFADGPKRNILSSKTLSELFRVDLKVSWSDGWCGVKPA